MLRGFDRPPRWAVVVGVAAAILLVGGTVAAGRYVNRNNLTPAEVAAAEASSSAARAAASVGSGPTVLAGRHVLFVGDSWTAGYGASDPEATGFVPLVTEDLSLTPEVLSVSGAGYAHVSPTGKTIPTTIEQTTAAPNLIVVMAGVNDAGEPKPAVSKGAADTIHALQVMHPEAQVLVLGPMPPSEKSVAGMTAVGETVRYQAALYGVRYVDTIGEAWLPVDQLGALIDPAKEFHPNDAGHRLIADHLTEIIGPMLPE